MGSMAELAETAGLHHNAQEAKTFLHAILSEMGHPQLGPKPIQTTKSPEESPTITPSSKPHAPKP